MQLDGRYAEMRATARVSERPLLLVPRIPDELELQARWFAGEFGRQFTSTGGETIEIVQFGIWNRESGPDFRDAAIHLNGELLRGCIELDQIDRNWETHGHATNPAFEDTVLHVFVERTGREFFTRTPSNRNVPQIRIDPATLADAFSENVPLAHLGRCHAPLKNLPADRVNSILDAAAQFRLRRKAARLRAKIDSHGPNESLFQEIAAALGYKENKLPMTLLAQRLPLEMLRQNATDAEALLFGVAGFLNARDLGGYEGPTRDYVRGLWDRWWPHREQFGRLILGHHVWRIVGTRPSNHPQRRLAALAAVVREWPTFRRALTNASIKDIRDFFANLDHPFWNTHYTLTAAPAEREMALVGESRALEIMANVLFPFWVTLDVDPSTALPVNLWSEYARLPARLTNRRVETGAARLFGDDPRRNEFLKSVAHQQGLLQIYEDFCLKDSSDCAQCPFPEQMRNWH